MASEQRKQQRVSGYAKVVLEGPHVPGYVRDLSVGGCQVAFMQPVEVKPGDTVQMRIIAEHDPAMQPFQVRLQVRWVKPDSIWFTFGGVIESPLGSESTAVFERLVEYYAGSGT